MRAHLDRRLRRSVALLVAAAVVVLVAVGLERGVVVSNLHNGLLALGLVGAGAYVLAQRVRHRIGVLLLAAGATEAVLFLGRQAGHAASADGERYLPWLWVWTVAPALALVTLAVLCFPDGRLPSRAWRPAAAAIVVVSALTASLSALWPVEYAATGTVAAHPLHDRAPAAAGALWDALAHPAYALMQVLWPLALVARWRRADATARGQLGVLLLAAAASVVILALGLLLAGSHVPGVLAATLVPVAAGWAVVRGRRAAQATALRWLSRARAPSERLPDELARAAARAVSAAGASLWRGDEHRLEVAGAWPTADGRPAAETLAGLRGDPRRSVHEVSGDARTVGALVVEVGDGPDLTRSERALLDDLADQATWVLAHVALVAQAGAEPPSAVMAGLTPRERTVLELMARGLSNRAIGAELFLSLKTVEPVVGGIFAKLGLPPDATRNRRVLAVRAYLAGEPPTADRPSRLERGGDAAVAAPPPTPRAP